MEPAFVGRPGLAPDIARMIPHQARIAKSSARPVVSAALARYLYRDLIKSGDYAIDQ
jgi:hypothetical protein